VTRTVIKLPTQARRGEIIEIHTLIGHPMETGFRHDQNGEPIARNIITRFACTYNGAEICRAEFSPAVTANPLLVFTTVATESGTLEFQWTGDHGFAVTATAALRVE
jgi:sulfur-oxidizing protein SoxZ